MSTTPLVKRIGREFIDFARRAVEIVCGYPWGVDQEIFLLTYYDYNPPGDRATRDFQWEEFKRARDYSNQAFDRSEEGWVWLRARRGQTSGQFFYQAVARIVDGEPEIVLRYPVSETLYEEKNAEWLTRTRSQMRVKVSNIEAKKRAALDTGNQSLLREAEAELDEVIVLAPRLAAIYFDTGMTIQDLRGLAASSKVPRLLQASVKKTLQAYERSQAEVRKLSTILYEIKQLRTGRRR